MSLATIKLTMETDAENTTIGDIHKVNDQPVFIGLDEAQPSSISGVFEDTALGRRRRVAQLVAQELWARFNVGRGEWFEDAREGFPWLTVVGQKLPDLRGVTAIFRRTLTTAPYVAEVLSLTLELTAATRALTVTWTVRSQDGLTVSGVTPLILDDLSQEETPS